MRLDTRLRPCLGGIDDEGFGALTHDTPYRGCTTQCGDGDLNLPGYCAGSDP